MKTMDASIQGPQEMQEEWFDSLFAMIDAVFRPDGVRSMRSDFPVFLSNANSGNLFVCRAEGEVICHIGYLPVTLSFFGHSVKLGMLGAVATHPQWRGRGLGTATLRYAFRKAAGQNISLMMISGSRGLYERNGARSVGSFAEYSLPAEALTCNGVSVQRARPSDAPLLAGLHRGKPFRFIRPLEVWEKVIDAEICHNTPSQYWLVKKDGEPAAYFAMPASQDDGAARLHEYGGDMQALVSGLGAAAADREDLSKILLRTYRHETPGRETLERAGARFEGCRPMEGTLRIVDIETLMNELLPYTEEVAGSRAAAKLRFRNGPGDRFAISYGREVLNVAGRGTMAEVLFSNGLRRYADELAEKKRLKAVLERLLPLTAPKYDMSFV